MKRDEERQMASDHLANERTLLAWIRTSIGIMAFGFVVVKFSLFVKQISLALGRPQTVHQYGYSAPIGIILVGVGSICLVLSIFQFRKTELQLKNNTYYQSSGLLYIIVFFILIISLFLFAYLLKTT